MVMCKGVYLTRNRCKYSPYLTVDAQNKSSGFILEVKQ
jgi:hypothetical protein